MCGEATGESRMSAESMGSHKDWTIMEEPRPPEMDVPYGGSEGGCLGGSEGTASFSSDPENSRMRRQGSANSFRDHSNLRMGRRPSLKKMNKLNWQIAVQDRESAELTSQRSSGTLSMKEQYDARFYKWLDWWMSLEEPERTGCLARFIFTKKFETACAIVIIGNAFFAAYTTNWEVTNLSEEPNSITEAVETSFLSFYLFELILKFLVHQMYFFCNDDMRWNIFDLFLVVTSVYYQVSLWATSAGGMDLTYMRTLRVLKLARILRVIRVAKIFTELRLMLNSVLGSFISLFWAFVMLGIVFYTFGLVFVQGTTTYLIAHGPELDRDSYERVVNTFGSVQVAMLSLFKATTGGSDWENIFDKPIIESMGALNIGLFIFLIAFIQVALLNILTGVFVENALKLAQPDRDVLALEHRKRELVEAEELREICEKLDMNGSGTIDIDEFRGNFQHGKLMAHLQVLGLQIKDADMFFHMLMDSSDPPPSEQVLDISDFVAGCMRLRGSATNLDLQTILYCLNLQNRGLRQFFTACDRRFMELAKRVGDLALPPARPFPMPRNGETRGSEATSGEVGCNGLTFFHTF